MPTEMVTVRLPSALVEAARSAMAGATPRPWVIVEDHVRDASHRLIAETWHDDTYADASAIVAAVALADAVLAAAAAAGEDEAMAEAADLLDGAQCVGCNPADPDGSYCGRCQRMHRASVALRRWLGRVAELVGAEWPSEPEYVIATLRTTRERADSALAECQRERDEHQRRADRMRAHCATVERTCAERGCPAWRFTRT